MASNTKLTILGTENDPTVPAGSKGSSSGGGKDKTFVAEINPEKLSLTKSISFNDENTTHAPTKDTKQQQGQNTDKLSFDLILDGTGMVSEKNVYKQLSSLNDTCYKIEGEIHKALYLTITYGDFIFKGHLESMTIDYNLFDSEGTVLRAKVALKFNGHINPETAARKADNKSPDMSHLKVIREGDSLPSMCKHIYGDIKYYIAIARINKLTNFRDIDVGTELLFPPLV